MRQQTLAGSGFEKFRKKTRKERFLDDMEQIIPWQDLCVAIEPNYPKPEGAGRRPVGIERMLRIHFLQHWFDLSDPGAEEALYDSRLMRTFVGIDLGREPVPDETTILNFRHLMERYNLGLDYLRDYSGVINALTVEDLLRAAQRYWGPGVYALAVAGPRLGAIRLDSGDLDVGYEVVVLDGLQVEELDHGVQGVLHGPHPGRWRRQCIIGATPGAVCVVVQPRSVTIG